MEQVSSLKEARAITIVGGAAVDIISRADVKEGLNSQMGSVNFVPGGALRNTAEAIGRIGWTPPTFISAVGADELSNMIRRSLTEAGVSADGLYVNKELPTAAYNAILNEKGEMFCGVSDMKVLEEIP